MGCMRVVFDTSVLVAGLRSRLGASNRVLYAIAEGRCVPLVSTAVFLEYEAVLSRPEQLFATQMSVVDVQGFLAAFASAAEPVEISFRWRPQLSDPADEMILEAAANGGADVIVTHNTRDFQSVALRFGIRTVSPAKFLKEVS